MIAQPFVAPDLDSGHRVILGEGPIWFDGKLLSVDIRRGLLRSSDLETGHTENVDVLRLLKSQGLLGEEAPTQALGCIAPTDDGRLLMALTCGIYAFDLRSQILDLIAHPEAARSEQGVRYNDGKVGPDGAFYVGSMGDKEGAGRFFRVLRDGSYSDPLVGGPSLTTPNGMHWFATEDEDTWDFCYICSNYPAIQRYEHRLSEGVMIRKPDLVSLPPRKWGYPDGMTGSDNGLLFLALYAPPEYGVIVIDASSGEIVERIATDTPQTTCPALIGNTLYITTAAQEYEAAEFAQFPNAGAIFRAHLSESKNPEVSAAHSSPIFQFAISN